MLCFQHVLKLDDVIVVVPTFDITNVNKDHNYSANLYRTAMVFCTVFHTSTQQKTHRFTKLKRGFKKFIYSDSQLHQLV